METKLGVTAKDTITGFEGVVLGRCEYVTGCNQVLIQPKLDSEQKFVESRWFDEDRIEVTEQKPVVLNVKAPGSDKPAPRI